MIIDAHTHLFPEAVQKNRSFFCRRDDGFRIIYENERARLASLEDLLRTMDRDGVEQSVICGFPWKDPVPAIGPSRKDQSARPSASHNL